MEEVNVLGESIKFMLLGMGVVYLFLYILILTVNLQAHLINKYFPETKPKTPTASKPVVAPSDDEEERRRVAAIVAAVNEFCKQSK